MPLIEDEIVYFRPPQSLQVPFDGSEVNIQYKQAHPVAADPTEPQL